MVVGAPTINLHKLLSYTGPEDSVATRHANDLQQTVLRIREVLERRVLIWRDERLLSRFLGSHQQQVVAAIPECVCVCVCTINGIMNSI